MSMIVDIFNTDKKYSIIYADPPWSYKDKRCSGNCENHYKTMPLKDILTLPIGKIADKDCALFLWGTYPMLQEALKAIEAWGFTYKTKQIWKWIFLWIRSLDTREYRTMFNCNKRKAKATKCSG